MYRSPSERSESKGRSLSAAETTTTLRSLSAAETTTEPQRALRLTSFAQRPTTVSRETSGATASAHFVRSATRDVSLPERAKRVEGPVVERSRNDNHTAAGASARFVRSATDHRFTWNIRSQRFGSLCSLSGRHPFHVKHRPQGNGSARSDRPGHRSTNDPRGLRQ